MTDDQMRGLFREMRDEPVPADSLVRVRVKVAQRTSAASRKSVWWWRLAVAGALAAVLILAVLWRTPQAPVIARKQIVAPKPVETAKVESRVIPDPPVVRRARPRRVSPVAKPVLSGAVAIRIETPDPDVVIILLSDEGPGF